MSEPSDTVVADLNKAMISSNSGNDKNEMALLMMSPSVNWAEFLTPAPMTIALLGHLLLIAGEKDFSLEQQKPEKGFQFIKHPESFRACLVQVSNTGWRAFNEAHKNMDAIRLYSGQVPDQVKKVVRTLVRGSDEDVKDFLPIELGKIERNSAECLRLAQSVEAKFEHVMDLTGELLEASSAARGHYEKTQEEVKLRREIALAKEKAAREKMALAKEQQEKLEKEVREAKRSWEKAVDSMPSGWDVLGMEVVETIVHGVVDMAKIAKNPFAHIVGSAATAAADSGEEPGVKQSPIPGPEPKFKEAGEQLKLLTTQLSEDLNSASAKAKGDSGSSSTEEPLDKKLQTMKVYMESLQEDLTGQKGGPIDKKVQELLKRGLEISKEGEAMAKGLTFSPENLKGIATQAAELKNDVMKLCTKIRAKTGGNPFTTKSPRQANMARSQNSTSKSAAKTAVEGARFKIAETRGLLEKQEDRYDQTCKQLKENNEELSKVLESLAELSPEKIANFDQIRDTLMKGIKALASVREQWQKLVEFFQFITNIIKVCQNESLKSFVDYAKVGQRRVLANGYADCDFMRDLIYEQVSQANTTSYVVWSISNTYVEISRNHLMSRLASLGQLVALDPEKERHIIEMKKTELMEGSQEAQEAIRKLVEEAKAHFHHKVEKRIKQIETELLKVLPPEDPARIKEINDTVSRAIKEADEGFTEDDF